MKKYLLTCITVFILLTSQALVIAAEEGGVKVEDDKVSLNFVDADIESDECVVLHDDECPDDGDEYGQDKPCCIHGSTLVASEDIFDRSQHLHRSKRGADIATTECQLKCPNLRSR